MTETDIYQLVGRAYCNGMVHGLEKAAAFTPATALGRDGIPSAPMSFNASPQFDVSKAREFNAALKARREFLQQAITDAGRAAGSSLRSSLNALSKGPEVTNEQPTAPEGKKGLWSKLKDGMFKFNNRMMGNAGDFSQLYAMNDFNSYLDNLNNI